MPRGHRRRIATRDALAAADADKLRDPDRALLERAAHAARARETGLTDGERALADVLTSHARLLVISPTLARAQHALRTVPPARWRFVQHQHHLRGVRDAPLLVVDGWPSHAHDHGGLADQIGHAERTGAIVTVSLHLVLTTLAET